MEKEAERKGNERSGRREKDRKRKNNRNEGEKGKERIQGGKEVEKADRKGKWEELKKKRLRAKEEYK